MVGETTILSVNLGEGGKKTMGERQIELTPALDEKWYEEFTSIGMVSISERLGGTKSGREVQKAKFLAGEIEAPVLDYPNLHPEELGEKEDKLLILKSEIVETLRREGLSKKEQIVAQAYRWKINESIAQIRLLNAIANRDMRRFVRYSEFIWGSPSKEVFAYSLNLLRGKIEAAKLSENSDLAEAAAELEKMLSFGVSGGEAIQAPSQEIFDFARAQTQAEFGSIAVADKKKLTAEEIKHAFEVALEHWGVSGWEVVILGGDISKTGISVSQEEKKVKIPETRKVGPQGLAELILHEIGTHVLKRQRGERSRLKLLGIGLDRYIPGEEGIATLREQVLAEKIEDFAGFNDHLAISLAKGLDGKPRNFRQLFEIMQAYFVFKFLKKGQTLVEAEKEAIGSAWKYCVWTFGGTDGKTPGICRTQFICYRQGNIGVWQVISKNGKEMRRFNVGKYDPANFRHVMILEQLGISDEDLRELEK